MKFHLNDYIIEIDIARYRDRERDRDREFLVKSVHGSHARNALRSLCHQLTEERQRRKLLL